jgi:two-component system response regulator ChvI
MTSVQSAAAPPKSAPNLAMEKGEAAARRGQVVIVDDDDLFRESLQQNLEEAGFAVTCFSSGAPALKHLMGECAVDLVLLDWKMPEMNGIEVLRRIRESNLSVPVLFLTILSDQIFEEAALLGGAVDFVEKSRSFSILLKRIDLILKGLKGENVRPEPQPAGEAVARGNLTLDLESSRARWRGAEVELTLTEFKMVHYLATHAGTDVKYRELYDLVHGEGFVAGAGDDGYRANIRTFIKRIRQKFRDLDAGFECIENYPGYGYRWKDDIGSAA